MKRINQFFIIIFLLISVISCKKDKNNVEETLTKETISGKWVVTGTSDYLSFEFNESGNYIIVKKVTKKSAGDQIILFGTYVIIDNKTIVLSDFGTIKISNINETSISISVILNSDPPNVITINATKQDDIANSSRTELLCRTWEMVTVNGEDVAGTEYEITVLFSKAGTYFVSYANPVDENAGGLAQWRWKDENEEKLCYSWEGEPICNGENEVNIPELTADQLTVIENEYTYVLQPGSNSKSPVLKTSDGLLNTRLKNGFFRE